MKALVGGFNQEKALVGAFFVIVKSSRTTLKLCCRYLRQWVMVWNGYDGHIYVTSATRLPRFQPPRELIHKQNTRQKNWYPTLLSKQLGQCPIKVL